MARKRFGAEAALPWLDASHVPGFRVLPSAATPRRARLQRGELRLLDLRTMPDPQTDPRTTFDAQVERLRAEWQRDPPPHPDPAQLLPDAVVFIRSVWGDGRPAQGTLFLTEREEAARFRGKMLRAAQDPSAPWLPGRSAHVLGNGAANYAHWMQEMLPRLQRLTELEAAGTRIDRLLWLHKPPAPFVADSLRRFFPGWADRLVVLPGKVARCEELVFFGDSRAPGGPLHRMKESTALLLDHLPAQPPTGPALFLSRGTAGRRTLLDEARVLDALAPFGVQRVVFDDMPLAEQAALVGAAPLLIGPHGAGLTNAMFLAPGAALVELTTTQYLRRCLNFADLARYRGVGFGVVVVDQVGDRPSIVNHVGNDLRVAPAQLPRLCTFVAAVLAEASAGPAPEG